MTNVDKNTVVIETMDPFIEHLSRATIVLDPRLRTKKEVEEMLKQIAIDGDKHHRPTEEDISIKQIVSGNDKMGKWMRVTMSRQTP